MNWKRLLDRSTARVKGLDWSITVLTRSTLPPEPKDFGVRQRWLVEVTMDMRKEEYQEDIVFATNDTYIGACADVLVKNTLSSCYLFKARVGIIEGSSRCINVHDLLPTNEDQPVTCCLVLVVVQQDKPERHYKFGFPYKYRYYDIIFAPNSKPSGEDDGVRFDLEVEPKETKDPLDHIYPIDYLEVILPIEDV